MTCSISLVVGGGGHIFLVIRGQTCSAFEMTTEDVKRSELWGRIARRGCMTGPVTDDYCHVIQKYPSCPLSGSMCPATAFPTCPCATATCGICRASRWTTTPCKCHPRRSAPRANTTSSSTSTWRPARGARRNWKDT